MTIRSLHIAAPLLCTLPLIWAACGGSDAPESSAPAASQEEATPAAPEPTSATAAEQAPAETQWTLVAIEPADGGDAVLPTPNALPTIRINSDFDSTNMLRMTGFSGCSRFLAMYTVEDGGSLSLSAPLPPLESKCAEAAASIESALMKSLESASGYSIDGGELTIRSENGTLRFIGG